MTSKLGDTVKTDRPPITLVGSGVVGRAILQAHVDAGISVCIADQNVDSLRNAIAAMDWKNGKWESNDRPNNELGIPCVALTSPTASPDAPRYPMVIESIPERLDMKRDFFTKIEPLVDPATVLCTNTSTLRISDIASGLSRPNQFCGMHFFMPVEHRSAVELIRGEETDGATIAVASHHIESLHKSPLIVSDSPGFIVNRLLSPYLNEALTLLCQGVSAEAIEAAAFDYGMPMSPLELIDTIGTRTMFDAGRVYWQAFPNRIAPSPLLAGLVKSKRIGKHGVGGLYDYDELHQRSQALSPATLALVKRYAIASVETTHEDIVQRLSIPMWIEAAIEFAEGTVTDAEQFNLAMKGGLGYTHDRSWLGFFDALGSERMIAAADRWSETTKAMLLSESSRAILQNHHPSHFVR